MKSETESIVVMVMNGGIPDRVRTFTQSDDAERVFRNSVNKIDGSVTDMQLDDALDNGSWEDMGGREVIICPSYKPEVPTIKHETLVESVNGVVDNIFNELSNACGFVTGDESPMMRFDLDKNISGIVDVVEEWIIHNKNADGVYGEVTHGMK